MSKFTQALLSNVNFDSVNQRRVENYVILHDYLHANNQLKLSSDLGNNVPLCYPFLVNKGHQLKQFLISNRIFIPTYWPNVEEWINDKSCFEYDLFKNLVCLPIDQRYSIDDMNHIINTLKKFEYA